MTIAQAVSNLKEELIKAGVDTPLLDAQLIVGKCADMSRVQILTYPDKILDEKAIISINEMAHKRINRMPMQYILGECEFMGLNFNVTPSVLIPRRDTEILVEKAIKLINENNYKTVLDIGTGSGAIAVSIVKYTNTEVTALDISPKALEIANKNAKLNKVKVKFIESDLFASIKGSYDLIVSNPPYIEKEVINTLEPDVKDYEPLSALDGGDDGLDFYRKITSECVSHINNKGSIIFEIGYNQGKAVSDLLKALNFENISIEKDLAGLDRIVTGYNLRRNLYA